MPQPFDIAGASDLGLARTENEDQFLIADLEKTLRIIDSSLDAPRDVPLRGGPRGRLLMVADGIGGQSGGERASELALGAAAEYVVSMLPWFFRVGPKDRDDEMEAGLRAAVERCQAVVSREAEREGGDAERMGTTLTMAYLVWPRLYVVHVGDSRCYLLRDGGIAQLTTDQTIAQRLVAEGALDADRAERSRFANVLWSSIGGGDSTPVPEVVSADLEVGDRVVLCTDGLTTHVDDERLEKIVAYARDAREACDMLIGEANEDGGSDNVTVIVARHLGD